jgi:hypothetical protein
MTVSLQYQSGAMKEECYTDDSTRQYAVPMSCIFHTLRVKDNIDIVNTGHNYVQQHICGICSGKAGKSRRR